MDSAAHPGRARPGVAPTGDTPTGVTHMKSISSPSPLSGGWGGRRAENPRLVTMAWPFWPSAPVLEPTRSPPSVHLLEKKMLLVFFPLRNLQGFQEVCATIGTETDMHFCYLTNTVQPRVSVSRFSHNVVPSAVKTLRVQDALKERSLPPPELLPSGWKPSFQVCVHAMTTLHNCCCPTQIGGC